MAPRFIIQDNATIRETRDDSPTRPRKRQRTDSTVDIGAYSLAECILPMGPVEDDPEFYRDNDPNARCYLRIGTTRFKVDGSLLAEASPVLQNLLADHPFDGQCPDKPLVVIANAEEFRALLWALYASPQERAAQPRDHSDLDRLLLIAIISTHYRCASLASWSKQALLHTLASGTLIASCSSAHFTRLLDCATRTHNPALLESTITHWAARLRAGSAPCIPAILAADAHELPRLRGVAYYWHLQTMAEAQDAAGLNARGATQFQSDPKLSNVQLVRLLSGHWSLVNLWERMRRAPPTFECQVACKGRRCAVVWGERWRVAVASDKICGIGSASVLALLAAMRELLAADKELAGILPAQCRLAALDAMKNQVKAFEDGLEDHFFGCV
ncbi:hypothetical protein R3P38DRAFT_2959716 [Favolaschia claudopus]|uniref:BTB domain-containing protein n=1 Tax=Favolaschia claudopus TaxID=2862362 RepID=A0AAW0BA59_9AGAR